MNEHEKLLIIKAQRGNLYAFEQLIYKYDVKIMSMVYNMINNTEDAHDIYQEIFIKTFKSIKKFKLKSEFYTWLYRIAVNTCITYRKTRQRHQHDSLQLNDEENWKDINKSDNKNPEQELLNSELNQCILEGIDKLSPKQKAVFVLRHYHGAKLSEIAITLECSEGTVKNYLFRATQKMKKSLQNYID